MPDSFAAVPPKVFISYSHDSDEHKDRVLALANRLRLGGIDATIDRYEASPPEGWPMWMERLVRDSDFVLIVCTDVYLKRAQGKEEPGKGHGARWECVLTYQQIYDAGSKNAKFVPILLQGGERSHIPDPLKPATSYRCTTDEEYEQLYRRLTNQHEIDKPALGKLRPLPVREVKQHFDPPRAVEKSAPVTPQPADHPTLWQVPHDRNPVFTGRIDALEALRNDLLKNGWQALYGLVALAKLRLPSNTPIVTGTHIPLCFGRLRNLNSP